VSGIACSGFKESLVLTLDGAGDFSSGAVYVAENEKLTPLHRYSMAQSLGHFYEEVIKLLGYSMFDEYKVMGLAPYGSPERFKKEFERCYKLEPNGNYHIDRDALFQGLLGSVSENELPSRKGQPFSQTHKDISAALQEALETIALHVLNHFGRTTGLQNVALAGGVIHNCSMNGKLLYSGPSDKVFSQPAAHGAGAGMGAALYTDRTLRGGI
jgi:carbamoyltransferase